MSTTAPPDRPPTLDTAAAAGTALPAGLTTAIDDARTPGARRRRPLALVLVAASLPMFMATLDNLVVTGALPVIARALRPSVEQLQWFVNAYTLAFATLMLVAASLGDRFGRRRVFVVGIAVFTLASVACALADTPSALIAARAVQGAGAAAIMPLSLALIADAVPRARRALAIGIWGGVSGLGVALGPLVGGAVVEGMSWEAIFWINVPVALVAVPLVFVALRESFGHRGPIDLVGLALAGTGVFAGVWGIVRGNEDGWTSAVVLSLLAASVLLLAAFVAWEQRLARLGGSPLVPLRLFRSRSFAVANVSGFAFSLGMFGAVFLLIQYFQIAEGLSPLEAGVRTLPWTAAPMLVAPLAGMLAPRLGIRTLLVTGLTLQTLALAWLALVSSGATYAELVPAFVLAGVGMGLTFAPSATAVLVDMDESDNATASSTNSTVREVGVALGVAVLVAVFQAAGGALTPDLFTEGLPAALWVGAASVGVGAIAATFLPRRSARPTA
ncbi:MFS transporter [Oerskovia sp. USHLN155]|uniref:MFS transporter n=1 Tax=Oerskovia sp. USHLN155 TaxID=3081288 RepID=UPI0030173747